MHVETMVSLFNPRAVAVIGVSEKPGSLGTAVLRNLVATGFAGTLYPVHPRLDAIEGIACVARISDLPEEVDVAFLALPATITVAAVEELAAAGVGNVIVGSSGYAEGGDDEGIERQRALGAVADRTGIRIVGPNCNGLYNAVAGVSIGFNTGHQRKLPAGGLAVLSHSGALFDLMARRIERLGGGLSLFVSVGNEVRCDVLDYLEHAIADPATRAIALLLDAIPSAGRFRMLAGRARAAGKPIVALKLGQSELGGAAATAHSSRMVGNADAYAAFFASCGVPTVATLEGLITAGVLMDRHGFREGGIVGFSTSGAGAALMADIADRHGIDMPAYSEATIEALRAQLRYRTLLNPTDLGSLSGMGGIDEVFDRVLSEPGASLVAALLHTMPDAGRKRFSEAMSRAANMRGLPMIVIAPGGLPDRDIADYRGVGAMVLHETDCAFEAIAALLAPPPAAVDRPVHAGGRTEILQRGTMLDEHESLDLLASYGLQVAETRPADSAEAAVRAAEAIGFPVALKGAGVAHKSDSGLVKLWLGDVAAVRTAYDEVGTPQVVVQAMRKGDIEAMVGVSHSPEVGPVLIAGLGGVFVEALRQTKSWALPVGRETIARDLDASALGRVLLSPRWRHAGSREAVLDAIMAVQAFALEAGDRLEAAEFNPLLIGADGAIAVDGLIIPAARPDEPAREKAA